jgi:hypothetical protein
LTSSIVASDVINAILKISSVESFVIRRFVAVEYYVECVCCVVHVVVVYIVIDGANIWATLSQFLIYFRKYLKKIVKTAIGAGFRR